MTKTLKDCFKLIGKVDEKAVPQPLLSRPIFSNISTGVFALDYALLGGYVEGQVTSLVGWEASGKTSFALKAIAECQKKRPDSEIVYADIEGSLDPIWAASLGVDISKVHIIQNIIDAERIVDALVEVASADNCSMIVVDSVPALVPQQDFEKSSYDAVVATRAKIMSRFCTVLGRITDERRIKGNPITPILINQWRNKIGVMYGDPKTMPGGDQQKFSMFTQVEFRKKKEHMKKLDHGDGDVVGYNEHAFTVKKHKATQGPVSGEFKLIRAETDTGLEAGQVDDYEMVIKYARRHGLISGGGVSQKLFCVDAPFKNQLEIMSHFLECPSDYAATKAAIILMKRVELKIAPLPQDGYLYGIRDKKFVEAVLKFVAEN